MKVFNNSDDQDDFKPVYKGWGNPSNNEPRLKSLRKKWEFEAREKKLEEKRRGKKRNRHSSCGAKIIYN